MGDSQIALAGGADSMSQAPYAIRDIRFGTRLGVDMKLEDMMWAALTDFHCKTPMGITAENLAAKYEISREEVDQFAMRSQVNWKSAHDNGVFNAELAPVELLVKKKPVSFAVDEHPRTQTTLDGLAKLPAVFKKGGTVTAGTASGICDGAGAIVLASEEACKTHNLKPLARLVSLSTNINIFVDAHDLAISVFLWFLFVKLNGAIQ